MSTYHHYGLKKRQPAELTGWWAIVGSILAIGAGSFALMWIWPVIGDAVLHAFNWLR